MYFFISYTPILLLLCFAQVNYAQLSSIQISGQIIDKGTQLPIAYATVELDLKGIGFATGSDGLFELSINQKISALSDTLRFRALGYKDTLLTIQQYFNMPTKKMELSPQAILIEPVDFTIGDQKSVIGVTTEEINGPAFNFVAGAKVAVFMENPNQNSGVIQSVSYFIVKERKYKAPFRVRLWAVDENGNPGKDLFTKNIIVQAQAANAWLTVDLEQYQIPIPPNGFFAGLELIFTEKKYQFKHTIKPKGFKKQTCLCQGPVLANTLKQPGHLTWLGSLARSWKLNDYTTQSGQSINFMIRSTLRTD